MSNSALIQTMTPVMVVPDMQESILFWQKLGFDMDMHVPENPPYDFVSMQLGAIEIMLQTQESADSDLGMKKGKTEKTPLYMRVPDLEAIIQVLSGYTVHTPRRTTFYGADEIFYQEPGGHIIGFAQFPQKETES